MTDTACSSVRSVTYRPQIDVERLRAALGPAWSRVQVVSETESTNADLLADAAAPERTLLVAEHQVGGRGRLDRTWTSPPRAGLTFSVRLRPNVPASSWGWLPLLTGVALRAAVAERTGVAATLKWPNDLLAPDGRKLAGILAQSSGAQTSGAAAVVGIGLNVDTTADELPVETATSLTLAGATEPDRTDLLGAVLGQLDGWLDAWTGAAGDPLASGLLAAYRAACSTLGQPVRVSLGDGSTVEGEAVDLDVSGRLVVQTGSGERAVSAGDVEHLRPVNR